MVGKLLILRKATLEDLGEITDIYNYAIENLTATFDENQKTIEERKIWFETHQIDKYPLIVAEEEGEILGWGSISPFRERSAYRFTGETSIYVRKDIQGQGIGTRLLKKLIDLTRESDLHTLIAVIADGNEASIRLHANLGFQIVGQMQEIGYKFEDWVDVLLMQKLI